MRWSLPLFPVCRVISHFLPEQKSRVASHEETLPRKQNNMTQNNPKKVSTVFGKATATLFLLDAKVILDGFGGDGGGHFRAVGDLRVRRGGRDGACSLARRQA